VLLNTQIDASSILRPLACVLETDRSQPPRRTSRYSNYTASFPRSHE